MKIFKGSKRLEQSGKKAPWEHTYFHKADQHIKQQTTRSQYLDIYFRYAVYTHIIEQNWIANIQIL